ncbi:MAG: hypothetical protein QNK18_10160 [Gammaproteobacteria bacterium]|nr:hypothetical protein [Gammaproteobacteria bacterium]MDJ0891539.1 hypothetical protein [Gammaproteobacteria bacterium]
MTSEPLHGDDNDEKRQGASDKGLDGALDTLQGILEKRHVVPDPAGNEPEPPPLGFREDAAESLPLLDEVVIPGGLLDEGTTGLPDDPSPAEPLEAMPPYADLLNRLGSELEIIIESCVDEALTQARQDLMIQIKNHLDIVLPEILYQLTRRQSEDPD